MVRSQWGSLPTAASGVLQLPDAMTGKRRRGARRAAPLLEVDREFDSQILDDGGPDDDADEEETPDPKIARVDVDINAEWGFNSDEEETFAKNLEAEFSSKPLTPRQMQEKMKSWKARTLTCVLCLETSDKVRWFITQIIVGEHGKEFQQPTGDLCWICGCALEVWPLKETKDLIEMHSKNAEFKKEFLAVRSGVAKAAERIYRMQIVEADKTCGMKVVMKAGLMTTDIFSAHFEMPPSSVQPQGQIVKLLGPEMGMLEGVVMNKESIPQGVPHFDVELFSEINRRLTETLLAPGDIHREGQAPDRFTFACNNMVGKRENALKYANFARVPKYSDVKQAVEEKKKALADEAAGRTLQQSVADAASAPSGDTVLRVVTGSRLDASDDAVPAPTPRRPVARRGGGQVAAPATPRPVLRRAPGGASAGMQSNSLARSSAFSVIDADTLVSVAPSDDARSNVDEKEKDTGLLDIMRILLGWNAGREMKGLERRMHGLSPDQSEELALLETTLQCGRVSTALQIPNLNKSEYGEMIKNVNFMILNGYILPCLHKVHVNRRYANRELQEREILLWIECISLKEASGEWSTSKATWASCLQEADALAADKPEEVIEVWFGSVFCDAWIRIFNKASEGDESAMDLLATTAENFVIRTGGDTPAKNLKPALDVAVKVMRGVLCMASPVPGVAGSDLEDLNYVFPPEGKTSTLMTDVPRIGRILIVKIKQSDALKARATLFNKHYGSQVVHVQKIQEMYKSLTEENENLYDLLKGFIEEVPAWQKCLRYGGTHHLQRALLSKVGGAWSDVRDKYKNVEDRAETLTLLKLVKTATAIMDQKEESLSNARKIHLECMEMIKELDKGDHEDKFAMAIDAFMKAPIVQNLESLVDSLRADSDGSLKEAHSVALELCVEQSLQSVTPSDLEIAAYFSFWEITKDLYPDAPAYFSLAVAVRTLNKASPGQQKANKKQPVTQRQKAIEKYATGLEDTEICLKELFLT